MFAAAALHRLGHPLDKIRKVNILTDDMIAGLALVDKRSYQAGLMGVNAAGLYKPPR